MSGWKTAPWFSGRRINGFDQEDLQHSFHRIDGAHGAGRRSAAGSLSVRLPADGGAQCQHGTRLSHRQRGVCQKVEPAEIEIGDPITFHREGLAEPITHRVIAIDTDARIFTTKGDNVSGVTDTVPFDSLIGRSSQFAIPLIGYVAVNIRTLPGILIACAVLLVVVLLAFLPDLFTKPSSGTPPEASPLPAGALTEEKPIRENRKKYNPHIHNHKFRRSQ